MVPGHPFHGQLSMADMRLRLQHTMQTTDGGRKLNQAVAFTGKAMGGALNQAKSTFNSWWNYAASKTESGGENTQEK